MSDWFRYRAHQNSPWPHGDLVHDGACGVHENKTERAEEITCPICLWCHAYGATSVKAERGIKST